jgi:hypothetical protein
MPGTSYPTEQAAVDAVRPGYKIVGRTANIEEVPNDKYNPAKPPDPSLNPQTIKKANGFVLSLVDANGKPDKLTISAAIPTTGTGGGKGGVGYEVLEGPTGTPTATATAVTGWTRLGPDMKPVGPNDPAAYVIDPKSPPGTVPIKVGDDARLGDPSTWTPIYENPLGPPGSQGRVIGLFDPKTDKVAASITAPPGSKPSDPSQWTPVYRTPGKTDSGIVGQWDPVNSELHAVSQVDGKEIVKTDDAIYVVDKNTGATTLAQTLTPNKQQIFTHPDGSIYMVNPADQSLTKLQGTQPPQTITEDGIGGTKITKVYNPETKTYELPAGSAASLSVDTGSAALKRIIIRNAQTGEVISDTENPNYAGAPQPAEPTINTVARTVPRWNSKTGAWEDVPNTNRIVASEALRAMAQQVTGQVIAGDISEDEAYKLLTAANAKMANDIAEQGVARAAAGDILTANAQGATTGASLLNQRSATTQNLIQNGLNLVTSTGGRYGNYSGGVLNEIPGFGRDLVQGAASFATEIGGGQAVYDTAVRMVQAADPNNQNPDRAAAVGALSQMMAKYKQATGADYPTVSATKALLAGQTSGGMAGPVTATGAPALV